MKSGAQPASPSSRSAYWIRADEGRIAEKVQLPEGYSMEWSGEFGALEEAKKRLAVIVPLGLLLILMLLYSLFNSVRDSLLALSGIPFAVAGGILGLYVAGLNFSVSAAVGFISLFGVSAMDGILLVSYIRRNIDQGMDVEPAIVDAALRSAQSGQPEVPVPAAPPPPASRARRGSRLPDRASAPSARGAGSRPDRTRPRPAPRTLRW